MSLTKIRHELTDHDTLSVIRAPHLQINHQIRISHNILYEFHLHEWLQEVLERDIFAELEDIYGL